MSEETNEERLVEHLANCFLLDPWHAGKHAYDFALAMQTDPLWNILQKNAYVEYHPYITSEMMLKASHMVKEALPRAAALANQWKREQEHLALSPQEAEDELRSGAILGGE